MGLTFIPRPSTGGTTNVDIGVGPSQIPTNAITETKVNTKLATYPILTKSVGVEEAQLTDNARVKSLIETAISPIDIHLVNIDTDLETLGTAVEDLSNRATKLSYKAISAESLEEGMYIHVYRDGTTTKCIRANAVTGHIANGYVEANFNNAVEVTYFKGGTVNEKGNDLAAGKIWLSNVTPGKAMSAPPLARSGHYSQLLGESIAPNKHAVDFGFVIKLT